MYGVNPILPGFYPDPSICRVDNDYYLITSSFSFFPGIPIFHSIDLVNWEQIGHVLERPSQLNLDGGSYSSGIFAPTIRYNNHKYYVITTNMTYGGNFIVHAESPYGPWSDPIWLDAPGIDPSLFFDDDGRAYVTGTRTKSNARYFGDHEIWIQELDLNSLTLIGDRKALWDGAMKNAMFVEAPHLYKKEGYYYLMISEGGTEQYHSITVARSDTIMGDYASHPANPILTHRHLGKHFPITNVGHGDLVETPTGSWYMVALGCRPCNDSINLGRETFITDVIWEDGWPLVASGKGVIECNPTAINQLAEKVTSNYFLDNFEQDNLDKQWNVIRTPHKIFWQCNSQNKCLELNLKPQTLLERLTLPSFEHKKVSQNIEPVDDCPAFIGRRIQDHSYSVTCQMFFDPNNHSEEAGIAIVQESNHQFRFFVSGNKEKLTLTLVKCHSERQANFAESSFSYENIEQTLACKTIEHKPTQLKIYVNQNQYSFAFSQDGILFQPLVENIDSQFLGTEAAGGFVGNYIGMYATSNGHSSSNRARFDFFEYKPNSINTL